MTLYLKYRSQNLSELDQEGVRETLKKIVNKGELPHAFLFAGPKGTGKTSSARILAKIINCENLSKEGEPCNECEQCISITRGSNLDVVELDAASHRGIDDVRALRDAVKLAPARAKKKVYIIDEAHMLTVEASNALLKTLEEPPAHVVFVLATTNPEKLIDTIKSRTTLVAFKKATSEEILRALTRIVKGEKIAVENKVLELVANRSDGSFRDAVKLLENLISQDKMSVEDVEKSLSGSDFQELISLLNKKQVKICIEKIEKYSNEGGSISGLIDQLILNLRENLLKSINGEKIDSSFSNFGIVSLLKKLIKAKSRITFSPIESLPLEIAVVEWCDETESIKGISKSEDNETQPKEPEKIEVKSEVIEEIKVQDKTEPTLQVSEEVKAKVVNSTVEHVSEFSDEMWRKILMQIKPINASVEALLRSSKPTSFDGHTLKLDVFYKFHKERLEDMRHRKILEDTVASITGSDFVKVVCSLTEPPQSKIAAEVKTETILTESGDADIINVAEKIFNS